MDAAVVTQANGSLQGDANGIAIYFPEQSCFKDMYNQLIGISGWQVFLGAYYGTPFTDVIAPRIALVTSAKRSTAIGGLSAVTRSSRMTLSVMPTPSACARAASSDMRRLVGRCTIVTSADRVRLWEDAANPDGTNG